MKKYVNEQLVDMTADEIAERQAEEQAWADGAAERNLTALRKERDVKLAETDWWASSDLTMTSAQTTYRQALRDITDNATSLDDVTWPEKP
tara:strand:+ start:574 stop:846 length:273 start_codon:yes stop_codon:yes gene_type:complete